MRFPPIILRRGLPLAICLLVTGCAYYNTFYNARSYYRTGLKQLRLNQPAVAKTNFDKAVEKSALVIKRWPRSRWVDDALFIIGMSYYHEQSYDKALRHFDQLSLAFPGSGYVPEAELYRGLALLKDKQYGPARLALDGVRQKYPRFADAAAFNVAQSFVERDEVEKGVDSLAAFVRGYPRSRYYREAVGSLADGEFRLKRFADAEVWYQRIARIATDPLDRAQAKLRIAACQYEQGRHQDAVRQIEDILGRYPQLDDEANLIMGKSLIALGRTTDAVATWSKVRGANDFGAEASFRIGKYHEEQSDFTAARAYYDSSRLRRDNSEYGVQAVKRLSLLDAFAQRSEGTREPAEALFLLAEVNNLNLEEYDKAMELYQQVHDSFPATDWAAKALFAKAWIVRNVKHDTAAAEPLLAQEIAEYPETEYADESRRWLGLPVPTRKPKAPEVKPAASEIPADTLAAGSSVPEVPPVPPEEVPPESGAVVAGGTRKGTQPPRSSVPGEELRRRAGEFPAAPPKPPGEEKPAPAQAAEITPPEVRQPSAPPARAGTAKTAGIVARFETDRWGIGTEDSASLVLLADSLKAHPDGRLVLLGFCDPRASEGYNQRLGLRRAQAVKNRLVALGVSADRLDVESRGEEQPISTKPDEYWLDRRVESAPR